MTRQILIGITAAAALAAGSTAMAQAAPGLAQQCFWPGQAQSFAPMGRQAVNVRVGGGDVYQLQLAGECPNIDWTRSIGLSPRTGARVCAGGKVDLTTTTNLGPLRCAVTAVRKLTTAEVAALPDDAKPR